MRDNQTSILLEPFQLNQLKETTDLESSLESFHTHIKVNKCKLQLLYIKVNYKIFDQWGHVLYLYILHVLQSKIIFIKLSLDNPSRRGCLNPSSEFERNIICVFRFLHVPIIWYYLCTCLSWGSTGIAAWIWIMESDRSWLNPSSVTYHLSVVGQSFWVNGTYTQELSFGG